MDCHKVLKSLTEFGETKEINDDQLKEILNAAYACIPENVLSELKNQNTNNVNDTGWEYLNCLLYVIKTLVNTELNQENPLISVRQLQILKTVFETTTSIGILPSLLPQIKIHATNLQSRIFKLQLSNNILEKYKRLSDTVNVYLQCYGEVILRPALIPQLNCLLAALLQLSHAPLIKPNAQNTTTNNSSSEFSMTIELYNQLKKEQECFCKKLQDLIENCPQYLVIKELMVIMAIKNNPKWLQENIKQYLTTRIMLPNGVGALTIAICDEITDIAKCWDKLDVTARLVATSHGSDEEKYYDSVCSQILGYLNSKNNKQGTFIANCFIKTLYDYKPDVCAEKIIHIIMEPLLVKHVVVNDSNIIKTEEEVSQCIENLCKLFITNEAEFKCLPLELLKMIALPLFLLYVKSYKSVYVLRNQVRQLLLKILADDSTREITFSVFLNHQLHKEYGKKLNFRFGVNGGIEVCSEPLSIENEELADCLFDLISKDGSLSFDLFTYLLKILPKFNDAAQNVQKGKLLETPTDVLERIEKQITSVKLLTLLSTLTSVQETQIKNPEPLLEFIKFYFSKIISSSEDDVSTYEQDISILYTSLMLIKIILTEKSNIQSWDKFKEFISNIKVQYNFRNLPLHIALIVEEIEDIISKKGKQQKNYYDLSADSKTLNEFDKAFADLADPLLPVRAHGIIALTKLIENRHPEAALKKDILLCIFQENLNHDDSFIYLAAINGLCAMSSMFPEKVIEILVQEFIGMTQENKNRDIPPETRAKLGEILVKTTRSLGEMTPKYKNLLVNGFLCGTRDPDPLVRASSLSCLGEFCKIMGFRLGNLIIEILYCIGCIIKTDKDDGCRRAGVLVATLLLRGLGKDALTELGENLVTLYRSLKHLRDNDKDPVLQLHAQLALEEFDDIVQQFLFTKPKLEKSIFLLS